MWKEPYEVSFSDMEEDIMHARTINLWIPGSLIAQYRVYNGKLYKVEDPFSYPDPAFEAEGDENSWETHWFCGLGRMPEEPKEEK